LVITEKTAKARNLKAGKRRWVSESLTARWPDGVFQKAANAAFEPASNVVFIRDGNLF
jgi:hypothetical protein